MTCLLVRVAHLQQDDTAILRYECPSTIDGLTQTTFRAKLASIRDMIGTLGVFYILIILHALHRSIFIS